MTPQPALDTNSRDTRLLRLELARRFSFHPLTSVPEDRYPEAHATISKILSATRVNDQEVQWAHGVVEGIRRTGR